jgi:hypothetical protein
MSERDHTTRREARRDPGSSPINHLHLKMLGRVRWLRTRSDEFCLRPIRGSTVSTSATSSCCERDRKRPGADVGRTRRTSFVLVRPVREEVDKPERKPVGWRAREWQRMLDEGVYKNRSELARGEGVSTAAVSIALRKLKVGR